MIRRLDRWFYVGMAIILLGAVALGFGRTYAAPLLSGAFHGPAILHVHGALAFSWILLFLVQPLLVRFNHPTLHRRIGRTGIPLSLCVALTMIPAGVYPETRDVAAGQGPTAISAILGVITSGVL